MDEKELSAPGLARLLLSPADAALMWLTAGPEDEELSSRCRRSSSLFEERWPDYGFGALAAD
jgi:hypothetical protein